MLADCWSTNVERWEADIKRERTQLISASYFSHEQTDLQFVATAGRCGHSGTAPQVGEHVLWFDGWVRCRAEADQFKQHDSKRPPTERNQLLITRACRRQTFQGPRQNKTYRSHKNTKSFILTNNAITLYLKTAHTIEMEAKNWRWWA